MARPEGKASKPTEGFEDVPIHLRARDEGIFKDAVQKAMEGDASKLDAIGHVTWNHVYLREDMADLEALDLENRAASVSVIADAALTRVGESLREARRRAEYTQAEAAKAVGLSEKTLWRIERGLSKPSLDVLIKLCWLYDVSVDRVLGMMGSDEEELLATYRATIDSNRGGVLALAQMVQRGEDNAGKAAEDAERLFKEEMRSRIEHLDQHSSVGA